MSDAGDLGDLRATYARDTLDEGRLHADPLEQFALWFADARAAGIREPHAMTLATAGAAGDPSARIVLLRAWDARGFAFYTNYASHKALELAARPRATLLFYWDVLERQVRIDGAVAMLPAEESDAYFGRRPRGHQLSAWASPQSRPVAGRATLDAAMAAAERRFAGSDVPRPPHWGGYRLAPARMEFWQGRPDRVHDRVAYARAGPAWSRQRLAP